MLKTEFIHGVNGDGPKTFKKVMLPIITLTFWRCDGG